MTAEELRAWRTRYRLSRRALAAELEMSESRLVDYERGESRTQGRSGAIPRVVELALAELGRRHAPAAGAGARGDGTGEKEIGRGE